MAYIFFDVDGTIWDWNQQIPQSTLLAIDELKKNGNTVFINSGRSRANIIERKLLDIGFSGILAGCGTYIEIGGKVVFEKLLSKDLVRRIIEVTQKYGMPVVLEGSKYHWISEKGFENDPFVDYLWESLGEKAKPLRGYSDEIEISKFSADIIEGTNFDAIRRELESEFDILVHDQDTVEFVPHGVTKATSIAWICKEYQVPIEQTYAIGDSVNDLDMLSFVGHGIAMGNASAAVKEKAEYITADIHEDGVYKAMKHYGLI